MTPSGRPPTPVGRKSKKTLVMLAEGHELNASLEVSSTPTEKAATGGQRRLGRRAERRAGGKFD